MKNKIIEIQKEVIKIIDNPPKKRKKSCAWCGGSGKTMKTSGGAFGKMPQFEGYRDCGDCGGSGKIQGRDDIKLVKEIYKIFKANMKELNQC